MWSLNYLSLCVRVQVLAVATLLTILANIPLPVIAQEMLGVRPSGGDSMRGGGMRGGIGPGISIGVGIGQEILRQQDVGPGNERSTRGAKSRGYTSGNKKPRAAKKEDTQPPRAPAHRDIIVDKPAPGGPPVADKTPTIGPPQTPLVPTSSKLDDTPMPFVSRPPEMVNCHSCDELLKAVLKYQMQLAEDEQALADLKFSTIKTALLGGLGDGTNSNLQQLIDLKTAAIAQERKVLDDLIAKYKMCLKEYQYVCPKKPKRHLAIVQVTSIVDQLPATAIDCDGHKGSIVVQTGVQIHWNRLKDGEPQDRKDEISISYVGSNCDDCIWVQFIWSEVVVQEKEKDPQRVPGHIDTTGGSYDLTTDPEKPTYSVDSASPTNPAYESTGTSNVGDTYDTMFDAPGNPFKDEDGNTILPFPVNNAKTDFPAVQNITWTDHFDTYLICDGRVCAKVSWSVSFGWQPGDPDKSTGPTFSDPTTSLNPKPAPGQYKALAAKYGVAGN